MVSGGDVGKGNEAKNWLEYLGEKIEKKYK
jgi:hypothetical protein